MGKGEGGELLKAAQSGLGGPLFLKKRKKKLICHSWTAPEGK